MTYLNMTSQATEAASHGKCGDFSTFLKRAKNKISSRTPIVSFSER